MDDLISRQAAIDEIKGFQQRAAEWRDEQKERSDIWHRADSAIASAIEIGLRVKKLPSAQQWISCSERLPEEEYVLISKKPTKISGDKWCVTIAIRMTDPRSRKIQWRDIGFGVIPDDNVLAWMPLPEPYKGGKHEAIH